MIDADDVCEGDQFERDRGVPDVWTVVEIEEHQGFGPDTAFRKFVLQATEYGDGENRQTVKDHELERQFRRLD
jgi:hypothetical protein